MTNPIFEHLPPGPQRDEAEAESLLATARATIARLERERDEARAESIAIGMRLRDMGGELAQATNDRDVYESERDKARQEIDSIPTHVRQACKYASPTQRQSIVVTFAEGSCRIYDDLVQRIAIADAKHPRSLPIGDGDPDSAVVWLELARAELKRAPTWEAALRCEFAEALVEFSRGNLERLADELLDVSAVATRGRRDVLDVIAKGAT